jgi:hypothetical protein
MKLRELTRRAQFTLPVNDAHPRKLQPNQPRSRPGSRRTQPRGIAHDCMQEANGAIGIGTTMPHLTNLDGIELDWWPDDAEG